MAVLSQSVSYAAILTAVKARLLTAVFDDDAAYVYVSKTKKPRGLPTERWLRVYPGPLAAKALGGGRYDTRVPRSLVVELFTKAQVDAAGDGLTELADDEIGHVVLEEAVLNALHLWTPMSDDATPLPLTPQPMRFAGPGEPPGSDDETKGFVFSSQVYETLYIPPLDITPPGG